MTLSEVSIRRPILTWMMTLALVVFGVIGFMRLGVDQFPNMEFPVLTVQASLDGATPEGMEEDVTDVIEERVNTIAGVRSIRSTSYQGVALITVEFELDKNLDVAAQEVRDKVALSRVELPVALDPPVVGTFNPNDSPVLWIPVDSQRTPVETSEAVRRQINPFIETIPGVAGVAIFGRLDRNIRVWLDGDQLRARGLSAGDVLQALQREHVELPGGTVESDRMDYSVKTDAEFRSVEEMKGLVVAHQNGAPVLLSDVSRVEDGSEDPTTVSRYNGKPAPGMGIRKQSGGNTVAIVDEVRSRLGDIQKVLPSGMKLYDESGYIDFSKGVREAVAETEFALAFGALLAVFTVWVFLRRSRPTFIIALAIPVSLIATFGLVYVAGFTLNTMTLLGMALAVGVVIDDAIVVLENIERHRELGESGFDAASKGTREIAFAATAATFSVAAVFVPVLFVQGLVGSFLRDFGLTVAGSVMISLFVALTLTPMLAARMPPPSERKHGSVYHYLERGFLWIENRYRQLLYWTLDHRGITVGVALGAIVVALLLGHVMKSEFFPPADEGIFFARLEAPPGSSLDATLSYLERDEKFFLRQPELAGLFSAAGSGGGGNEAARHAETNMGLMFGTLKPRTERKRSVMELVAEARKELGQVPGREVRIFNPSEMMTGGSQAGSFEVQIQGNLDLAELDHIATELIHRLEKLGGFVDLSSSLKLGLPEVRIVPDREKAASLGVDSRTVAQAIQMMIGGMDVGVFKEAGRRYDIRMRLEAKDRQSPEAIGNLYVRTKTGETVELRNLIRIETGAAASAITRTNRQRSVTVGANLTDGRTLGQAVTDAQAIAKEIFPAGVKLALSGQAEAMEEGARQFGLALGLGILVIYMVLAAQFESLVHPLTVMLALPFAMTGALGGLWFLSFFRSGMTLNLFSMIGILLLFGLVTKNSILLVDYANQLRREGMDKVEAVRKAAPVRLRPVLMTAISMIFGVLPAAFGIGPGAETRAPMAVASGAGMFSSMLLTLIVVPVFYLLFDDAADWVKRGFRSIFGAKPAKPATPLNID